MWSDGLGGAVPDTERPNRARDILAQGSQRIQNRPILKLSLAEQYRQGVLQIATVFKVPPNSAHHAAIFPESRNQRSALGVPHHSDGHGTTFHGQNPVLREVDSKSGGDQKLVLICDVKGVKVVKLVPAAGEWFQFIQDKVDNRLLWFGLCGLSFKRTFNRFEISSEGEFNVSPKDAAIIFDQNPVSVIEADPEVMDSVSDDGWQRARKFSSKTPDGQMPRVQLLLGSHGFGVRSDVASEYRFELADVVIGSFYLKEGSIHGIV